MPSAEPLNVEQLRRRCEGRRFSFVTTAELDPPAGPPGQSRALAALELGAALRREGFNVFVLGPQGFAKHWLVQQVLGERAAQEPAPLDWAYVHCFSEPRRPRALGFPPGRAVRFQAGMGQFVERLSVMLPAAFETEDHRRRVRELEKSLGERREQAFEEFKKAAEARDVTLVRTPTGLALAPLKGGRVLSHDEFHQLPEAEGGRLRAELERQEESLRAVVERMPELEHQHHHQLAELNRSVGRVTVAAAIKELKEQFSDLPKVLEYLASVEEDVVDNVHAFVEEEGPSQAVLPQALREFLAGAPPLARYKVNVLVSHAKDAHAPVVYEDFPTHHRLVGKVEHRTHLGSLVTDFSLIRSGALHEANGGYLVVDAERLLVQPFSYAALKRALQSREVRISHPTEALGLVSTDSLEPEPVPLDVKVVLIGERRLYYLLAQLDPEFMDLFKVAADFEDDMPRDDETELLYARLVAAMGKKEELRPLEPDAMRLVVEQGSRLAADREKLSLNTRALADLLREADHWAQQAGKPRVTRAEVQRALDEKEHRSDRLRARLQEAIARGFVLVEPRGEEVGQVLGLSVLELADFSFGQPVRITARTRFGKGEVLDIERQTELGGPLHSKGVMILTGFLAGRYLPDGPLALAASLVFEQSYGPVEGDSASAAELFALLSSLAGVPVRQALAVTGSVDQRGRIQPVGGVNEKVEGYFDVCRQQGLTGREGVLVPRASLKSLMLREDVLEAVKKKQFAVYAIDTVDEGLELLTGLTAGERERSGAFPPGSLNRKVEDRLLELARRAHALAKGEPPAPPAAPA